MISNVANLLINIMLIINQHKLLQRWWLPTHSKLRVLYMHIVVKKLYWFLPESIPPFSVSGGWVFGRNE